MNLRVAVGVSQDLSGHTAAQQATHRALDRLGSAQAVLAIVFAAQEFSMQQVLAGTSSLLGNTPQWGFSTTTPLTQDGLAERAVAVALIAGEDLKAQAQWWPGYAQDLVGTVQHLTQGFPLDPAAESVVLLAADGIAGDAAEFLTWLNEAKPAVAGALAAGDYHMGKTYQVGGSQYGSGGLASAILTGKIKAGVGLGHGWKPAGPFFQISKSLGSWVRLLDGKTAADMYSQYFGFATREWSVPPLADMVRLYPLGLEAGEDLQLRSPLRVEADGSIRMNAPVKEGSMAHLMVGTVDGCLEAARGAAEAALADLDGARPVLALVFADIAWQRLMALQAGQEMAVIREVLPDTPILGAYTLGQIAGRPAGLFNQQIEVVLLGETE